MADYITKGSNKLILVPLYQEDETELEISSLSSCVVDLVQKGVTLQSYTLGTDNEIREGEESHILEIEITNAVSTSLSLADLEINITLEVSDSDFVVDGVQRAKKCIILNVESC